MEIFNNWNDYREEIEKTIQDKVLEILVEALSQGKHTRIEKASNGIKMPILSPSHPFIADSPKYSKLPPE